MNTSMRRASLAGNVGADIEVTHFAGHLAGHGLRVELADAGDAGFAGDDVGPTGCDIVADRLQAKAGDDDSASCQDALLTEEQNGVFAGKCMHAQTKTPEDATDAGRVAGGVWTTVLPLARQREP